jgi:Phosphoesterase family
VAGLAAGQPCVIPQATSPSLAQSGYPWCSRIHPDGANPKNLGQLQNIDHIVVLMLENRSFDSLLGKLCDKSASFDGLSGTEQNPDPHDSPIPIWNSPGTAEATVRIPDPDPGELWTDINSQLFSNAAGPRPGQSPSMDGFVRNYLAQKQLNPTGTYDATMRIPDPDPSVLWTDINSQLFSNAAGPLAKTWCTVSPIEQARSLIPLFARINS